MIFFSCNCIDYGKRGIIIHQIVFEKITWNQLLNAHAHSTVEIADFYCSQRGKSRNSLSLKKISSNLLISLVQPLLSRNSCGKSVRAHCCRNCRNFLSHFFRKNFVKAMVLLKKLLNSWFDEIFFRESKFIILPHCGNYSCTLFDKNFMKRFAKELISRNIFSFRDKFLFFHAVEISTFHFRFFAKKMREIDRKEL